MLLFSFQPGSTWSSDTFAVPPSQQPALQQAEKPSQIFTVKQLQHFCYLEVDCIKVQHHFCFISISIVLRIQFQGFLGKLATMWEHSHSHSHWVTTASLQGRLLFQLSCEECHLRDRSAYEVVWMWDAKLKWSHVASQKKTDCWIFYGEAEVEEIWKNGCLSQ